jgi:hypothetical protein
VQNVSESPVGRRGIITLMTLSDEEVRSAAKLSVGDNPTLTIYRR